MLVSREPFAITRLETSRYPGHTRINVAVAALTNSYAAIAFGDRVITYSRSANTRALASLNAKPSSLVRT